jgi:hypothetical protein
MFATEADTIVAAAINIHVQGGLSWAGGFMQPSRKVVSARRKFKVMKRPADA